MSTKLNQQIDYLKVEVTLYVVVLALLFCYAIPQWFPYSLCGGSAIVFLLILRFGQKEGSAHLLVLPVVLVFLVSLVLVLVEMIRAVAAMMMGMM